MEAGRREPALDQLTDTRPQRQFDRAFAVTVPTWVHVVSPDGVTGNVSQALINDQIQVLNTTFGGGEGGFNAGFTFQLAGVTGPSTPIGTSPTRAARSAR